MSFYLGDSSDEEEAYSRYSKGNLKTKVKKLSNNDKIEYFSSFIFEEVSQSLLEHPKVVERYRSSKVKGYQNLNQECQNQIDILKSYNRYFFGQHLINKHLKEEEAKKRYHIYKQLYYAKKETIDPKIQEISGVLRLFESRIQDVSPSNYEESQKLYKTFFKQSNLIEDFKKRSAHGSEFYQSLNYKDIKLSEDSFRLLPDPRTKIEMLNWNSQSVIEYFEKYFTTQYLQSLMFSARDRQDETDYFLNALFEDTGLSPDDFKGYIGDILASLSLKKLKVTSDDSNQALQILATKVYVDSLCSLNQELNKLFTEMKPPSLFSSKGCCEFLAAMKLDHKVVRSYVKEIGIRASRTGNLAHKLKYPEASTIVHTTVSKNAARKDFRDLSLRSKSTTYIELVRNELNLKDGYIGNDLIPRVWNISILICYKFIFYSPLTAEN